MVCFSLLLCGMSILNSLPILLDLLSGKHTCSKFEVGLYNRRSQSQVGINGIWIHKYTLASKEADRHSVSVCKYPYLKVSYTKFSSRSPDTLSFSLLPPTTRFFLFFLNTKFQSKREKKWKTQKARQKNPPRKNKSASAANAAKPKSKLVDQLVLIKSPL